MIDLDNIRSLTDFNRNTKEHVRRLKKTSKSEALTVNGQAEVVVQSATAYQKLLEQAELAETREAEHLGEDLRHLLFKAHRIIFFSLLK